MSEMGGYRAPADPAPVSGPGALSQRTDGQPAMQLPDAAYGEQAEFQAIQQGAPMALEGPVRGPVPLLAPDDRPDVPLTSGIPSGDGPGPEVLSSTNAQQSDIVALGKYLPVMEKMAGRMDAPQAFRSLVQFIKANAQ